MRRHVTSAIAAVFLVTVMMASASATSTFTHATGGIWLSEPAQYVGFNAFDYGDTGDRGTVNYTNFDYLTPGSGAWVVQTGTYAVAFDFGAPYVHTMNIDSAKWISASKSTFSGTGFYNVDPSYTWTMTGSIISGALSFHIVYTGTNAGYAIDAVGSAATMSGSATTSAAQSATWTLSPSIAHEVFSYTATVTCAVIGDTDASFGFTIPATAPALAGTPIVMSVHDGGTPGTNGDTYGHAVGTCGDPVTAYTIVGGNLVVH
jgi:hypothetical protein